MIVLPDPLHFQWDAGNDRKNEEKHAVSMQECEEVFFEEEKLMSHDLKHSHSESRHVLLGRTQSGRLLFIVFTIRNYHFIRVISARDVNKREKLLYEKATEHTKIQK